MKASSLCWTEFWRPFLTTKNTKGTKTEFDALSKLVRQIPVHGLGVRFCAGVVYHEVEGGAGMVGEAVGQDGFDALGERAAQFFDFIKADADGGVEVVLGGKLIGEDIGLGEGGVAVRLVGMVTAYVEIERCVGRVIGEGRGAFACAVGCIVELDDAVEWGRQI